MNPKPKVLFVGNSAWSMYNFRIDTFLYLSNYFEVIVLAPIDEYSKKITENNIQFVELHTIKKDPKLEMVILLDPTGRFYTFSIKRFML